MVKREAEAAWSDTGIERDCGIDSEEGAGAGRGMVLQVENFDSSLIFGKPVDGGDERKTAVGGLARELRPFIEQLAAPTATPGGGSAAARRRGDGGWTGDDGGVDVAREKSVSAV